MEYNHPGIDSIKMVVWVTLVFNCTGLVSPNERNIIEIPIFEAMGTKFALLGSLGSYCFSLFLFCYVYLSRKTMKST